MKRAMTLCAMNLLIAAAAFAGEPGPVTPFTVIDSIPAHVAAGEPWVRPDRFSAMVLDQAAMRDVLHRAPSEEVANAWEGALFFWLPDPQGRLQCFRIIESSIMEPGLQAQFPQIRTFVGQGVDDLTATLRLDFTDPGATWFGAGGFHAQVLSSEGSWYIDPYTKGDFVYYTSHYKNDLQDTHHFQCHVDEAGIHVDPVPDDDQVTMQRNGATLRTYRLANACTGEYAEVFGGTVAGAQNAIVTAINRVTGVYEREFAVRLVLVANNTSVVYTNASTDPFTNNNGSTMLGQNQTNMTSVIGSANYDIGHVFSTGGGGIAGLGVVCSSSRKANGVTGLTNPTGDAFYIDYVAHEMGHQFGGNHTFNSPNGSCAGNRASSAAYEPGSASTIMGYAGICSPDDLQPHSDDYFHSKSFDEMLTYFTTGTGGTCPVSSATGNTFPTVSAGPNYTIPIGTPFVLTATASDVNGDTLTYCWEARNLPTAASALTAADDGIIPLFRSFNPTTSPSRTFPKLATILAGTTDNQEKLPAVARTLPMRVTVRDNRAGGGGVNTADMTLTISAAAGPFNITSQNSTTFATGNGSLTVTWNVANTTAAPISCANVKIDWSNDGGSTWTTLIASTPNDGSEVVTVPNSSTTQGRVRVSAIGNIFFDINNANISVSASRPATPTNLQVLPNPACAGGTLTLSATVGAGATIDWYQGSCGGTVIATGTTVTVPATVSRTFWAIARDTSTNLTSSSCAQVSSTVIPLVTAPTSASASRTTLCENDGGTITLTAFGGSGTLVRWYSGSCGGALVGTGTPLTISAPTTSTTYFASWENQCGVSTCASAAVTVLPLVADFNHDGLVDFFDYLDFVDAYSAGLASADFNADLSIDFFDYLDFVNAYSIGGC